MKVFAAQGHLKKYLYYIFICIAAIKGLCSGSEFLAFHVSLVRDQSNLKMSYIKHVEYKMLLSHILHIFRDFFPII